MPPAARTARQRALHNENDENAAAGARLTRAKAATLSVPDENAVINVKAQAKKIVSTTSTEAQPRKRAALGDVSNLTTKSDVVVETTTETKKTIAGPTARARAVASGTSKISKPSVNANTASARPALGTKDRNAPANDLKRAASTATTNTGIGQRPKKRSASVALGTNIDKSNDALAGNENEAPATAGSDAKGSVRKVVETDSGRKRIKPISQEALRAQRQLEEKVTLMDEEDNTDPLMVSEYVYDIIDYMKVLEERTMPNADYMSHQKELEWRMRDVLLDWLLEVHTRFHLLPETLYLTVNIIDRFLSLKVVQLHRLQLVGVAAMFIASKYEEVLSPHIGNFVHVADDGFTEEEVLQAERHILQTLDYDLSFPNPMHFMRRISKADNYDIHTRTLAKYLLEISLLDHRLMKYKPSVNAAAAMKLSRTILEKGEWDDVFAHYAGYSDEDITPAVTSLIRYLSEPIKHNAFYRKYAGKRYMKASLHASAWARRAADRAARETRELNSDGSQDTVSAH